MNISPDQARELLDGATPGPWMLDRQDPDEVPMIMSMRVENGLVTGTYIAEDVEEDGDARLIAAAQDLAQTIAGMTEQIGVQYKRNNGKWGMFRPCQSSSEAMNLLREANGNARLAHRYVTTPEEVKP